MKHPLWPGPAGVGVQGFCQRATGEDVLEAKAPSKRGDPGVNRRITSQAWSGHRQPKLLGGPGAGVTGPGAPWQRLLSADPMLSAALAQPRTEPPSTLAAHPIPLLPRFLTSWAHFDL